MTEGKVYRLRYAAVAMVALLSAGWHGQVEDLAVVAAPTAKPHFLPSPRLWQAGVRLDRTTQPSGELFDKAALDFASRVDIGAWERLAVQDAGGVLRPLDSLARRQLRICYGRGDIGGVSPTFAFLEMYFNAGAYPAGSVIQVRGDVLRVIPLAVGTSIYLAPAELKGRRDGRSRWPGLTEEQADDLHRRFVELARVWSRRDAERTNAILGELHGILTRRGAGRLPAWRVELELLHNRFGGFTIVWCVYALAAVLLLTGLATGRPRPRRRLRRGGMAVFILSTVLLAVGVCMRWIISGRGWRIPPLTNQYESVLAAALLGAVVAYMLERKYTKGVFALASSIFATVALLAAFFQAGPLRAEIEPTSGIIHSPILTWHVATIVTGYAMIGMSLVVSVAYLVVTEIRAAREALEGTNRRSGSGQDQSAGADLSGQTPAETLAELDRCNLILIQLGFMLIAVGVALGSYCADKAWGRWWGWDPKETWALMTLLVYLAILHLRYILPDQIRGLWTAALGIFGCGIMAFTWWGVTYFLPSLHGHGI